MSDADEIDLMTATQEQLRAMPAYQTAPTRICLALGDEPEDWLSDFHDADVTWATDEPVLVTVGYIREDVCEKQANEIDRLRAELAEARRLLDEARKQEPVAWAYHFSLHAYHDDFFDNEAFSDVLLKRRRELSPDDAFGRRGRDFDEKALITEVPLYAAPVPAQPAVPDDVRDLFCKYDFWQLAKINDGRAMVFVSGEQYEQLRAILSATDTEGRKDG